MFQTEHSGWGQGSMAEHVSAELRRFLCGSTVRGKACEKRRGRMMRITSEEGTLSGLKCRTWSGNSRLQHAER